MERPKTAKLRLLPPESSHLSARKHTMVPNGIALVVEYEMETKLIRNAIPQTTPGKNPAVRNKVRIQFLPFKISHTRHYKTKTDRRIVSKKIHSDIQHRSTSMRKRRL
jgi:hypothetical protein